MRSLQLQEAVSTPGAGGTKEEHGKIETWNIEELYEILSYLFSGPLFLDSIPPWWKCLLRIMKIRDWKIFSFHGFKDYLMSRRFYNRNGENRYRETEARHRTSESWKPRNSRSPRSSLMCCISLTVFFSHLQGPRKGQSVEAWSINTLPRAPPP